MNKYKNKEDKISYRTTYNNNLINLFHYAASIKDSVDAAKLNAFSGFS